MNKHYIKALKAKLSVLIVGCLSFFSVSILAAPPFCSTSSFILVPKPSNLGSFEMEFGNGMTNGKNGLAFLHQRLSVSVLGYGEIGFSFYPRPFVSGNYLAVTNIHVSPFEEGKWTPLIAFGVSGISKDKYLSYYRTSQEPGSTENFSWYVVFGKNLVKTENISTLLTAGMGGGGFKGVEGWGGSLKGIMAAAELRYSFNSDIMYSYISPDVFMDVELEGRGVNLGVGIKQSGFKLRVAWTGLFLKNSNESLPHFTFDVGISLNFFGGKVVKKSISAWLFPDKKQAVKHGGKKSSR